MNKRLKFIISFILVLAVCVGSLAMPASSFDNDVETSTADILMVNLDTRTTVFSQKPDNMWYSGGLSTLMTFLVAYENINTPEKVEFTVDQSFLSYLPYTDGSLDKYVGVTLTAYDLMAIMLLTAGSDAAYALADIASDGDRAAFVELMNEKAGVLGLDNTGYISPGYSSSTDQYTTCRDVYTLYTEVRGIDFFKKVMAQRQWLPEGLEETVEGEYTTVTKASIINPSSPYYFKYCNDAVFTYTSATYANIVLTTTYRGKTYFYVGLLGLDESERNTFSDAKRMTTWAYLNLSDSKMIDTEDSVTKVTMDAGWGEYEVDLFAYNSAYKTLPNNFDSGKLTYDISIPDHITTPAVKGQAVGSAKLTYDGENLDDVELVIDSDEGLNLLSDTARFANDIFYNLFPEEPEADEENSETEAE